MHPTNWKQQGERIAIGNQKWFVQHRIIPGKPVLLLLHGFPTSSYDWYKIWPALQASFSLIAPDFLGFGWSDKPYPHHYRIQEQADGCCKILGHFGIQSYHILAHDYGNTVAQELLSRQVEGTNHASIASIIFLNGGLFPEVHRPRTVQKLLAGPLGPLLATLLNKGRFSRTMQTIFGADYPPSTEDIDAFWSLIVQGKGKRCIPGLLHYMQERKTNRERWVPPILTDTIPIRLINGPEDPISGRHMARHFSQLKPGSDVVYINGVGHYPQVEAPDAVVQAIQQFHQFGF